MIELVNQKGWCNNEMDTSRGGNILKCKGVC